LRFQHRDAVRDEKPRVAWLEVHPENYMGGGKPFAYLGSIRRDYPISLQGVGLSLGSADGLDSEHLKRLRRLIERVTRALSRSIFRGAPFPAFTSPICCRCR